MKTEMVEIFCVLCNKPTQHKRVETGIQNVAVLNDVQLVKYICQNEVYDSVIGDVACEDTIVQWERV